MKFNKIALPVNNSEQKQHQMIFNQNKIKDKERFPSINKKSNEENLISRKKISSKDIIHFPQIFTLQIKQKFKEQTNLEDYEIESIIGILNRKKIGRAHV